MSVEHTSRTGKTYYLHEKATAAGKHSYCFSLDSTGDLVGTIPDGHEVHESVDGRVFLRKKGPQTVLPEELALVEEALLKHGEPWRYRAEVKKSTIVVHEAGEMKGIDGLLRTLGRGPLSNADKRQFANYIAVLRFALADKKARAFVAERFCFRGSIDDWIPIGGVGTLASLVRQFVKHLGRDSFYELF